MRVAKFQPCGLSALIIGVHVLPHLLAVAKVWYAAHASSNGGTIVRRAAKLGLPPVYLRRGRLGKHRIQQRNRTSHKRLQHSFLKCPWLHRHRGCNTIARAPNWQPDRASQVRIAEWTTSKVAANGDHPAMAADGGTSNRSLIPCRRNERRPVLALDPALLLTCARLWMRAREGCTQVHYARAWSSRQSAASSSGVALGMSPLAEFVSAKMGCTSRVQFGQIAGAGDPFLAHKMPATKVPCMQAKLSPWMHVPEVLSEMSRIFSAIRSR